MIIPSHLQIETINGVCTSRCVMCSISSWTRKPRTMTTEQFEIILDKFKPYRDSIEFLTIHGCGEPLLDPTLAEKIKTAKELGFRGTGFATNCSELNQDMARKLLDSDLDTIICSIDGINKATHESIRVGTDFNGVVSNVRNFIRMRNKYGRTRVMIRFIRQQINRHEWLDFHELWTGRIAPSYGDEVVKFDVHNWGNKPIPYEDLRLEQGPKPEVCQDVFERMLIYSDGSVGLCCADDNGFYDMGNVLREDPIEIYQNDIFTYYRQMMRKGRLLSLKHCATCSIPRSRALKMQD